jgi:hypothetical protein
LWCDWEQEQQAILQAWKEEAEAAGTGTSKGAAKKKTVEETSTLHSM